MLAVGYAGVWVFLFSGRGTFDPMGRAIGGDFAMFYGVSVAMRDGASAASLYDISAFQAAIQPFAGAAKYVWMYPPTALLFMLPLAFVSYLAALALWNGVGMAAYLTIAWSVLPELPVLIAAALAPAAFIGCLHGQNGLVVAAAMGAGALLLSRRPFVAGVVFALATGLKPQVTLLVPVVVLATRRWRAVAGAVMGGVALVVATTLRFGTAVWTAFAASAAVSRRLVENPYFPYAKMASVFGAARLLGGPVPLAWAVQGLATVGAAVVVLRVWRGAASDDVKAATLILGSLLATPYGYDYDLAGIAIALVIWGRAARMTGWYPWEKSTVLVAWAAPFFMRSLALLTGVGVVPALLVWTLWLLATRARLSADAGVGAREIAIRAGYEADGSYAAAD